MSDAWYFLRTSEYAEVNNSDAAPLIGYFRKIPIEQDFMLPSEKARKPFQLVHVSVNLFL